MHSFTSASLYCCHFQLMGHVIDFGSEMEGNAALIKALQALSYSTGNSSDKFKERLQFANSTVLLGLGSTMKPSCRKDSAFNETIPFCSDVS